MFDTAKLIKKNKNLKKENLAVCKINQDLNKELNRNKFNTQETINLLDNMVRDLLNLQEINNIGISEEEKNKRRNIIINALVENCLDKINELSSTDQSFR
ncbi:MAG: hypothetical protein U0L98_01945 [Clostridia bacterium]|nr:hypothetical protein [Clostridia bacterium]